MFLHHSFLPLLEYLMIIQKCNISIGLLILILGGQVTALIKPFRHRFRFVPVYSPLPRATCQETGHVGAPMCPCFSCFLTITHRTDGHTILRECVPSTSRFLIGAVGEKVYAMYRTDAGTHAVHASIVQGSSRSPRAPLSLACFPSLFQLLRVQHCDARCYAPRLTGRIGFRAPFACMVAASQVYSCSYPVYMSLDGTRFRSHVRSPLPPLRGWGTVFPCRR